MIRKFESHITEEWLELYALGRLPEEKAEVLEEHILICEGCRERLDGADAYVRAMRSGAARLRREEAPRKMASRSHGMADWFRMPAAAWGTAAAALCVVVIVSVTQTHRNNPGAGVVAATLIAERGAAVPVPANHPLDLTLDARGLQLGSQSKLELVDANGKVIEEQTVAERNAVFHTRTREGLAPGSYYVRVYAAGGTEPAREYALSVR